MKYIIAVVLLLLLIAGGLFFARANLRLGRGDRRGATRLALFIVGVGWISWLVGEHHVATLGELALFWMALGSTVSAALVLLSFSTLQWSRLSAGGRRRSSRLYIDTSAYLCILLRQEGAESLSKETSGAELLSSVLLVLEARRNLIRLARETRLSAVEYKDCVDRLEQDLTLFDLRDLTLDTCESVALPAVTMPRSLDLAHLRTALWFHSVAKIDRFMTMDRSQEQAAKELGLPV